MEKLMYPVWKSDQDSTEAFNKCLLGPLRDELLGVEAVRQVRICVVDEAVREADAYRIENSQPPYDAVISLWMDSAILRAPVENALTEHVARYHGYLVTESEPMTDTTGPRDADGRAPGMDQVVFLTRPPRLAYEEWLDTWLNSHTWIAIDTQDTTAYRQNVIVRALTYAAPGYDAVVEEQFPADAISSRDAFYDARDNEARRRDHEQQMMESCARFIDFDKVDCVPTSDYLFERS